jgi:hypothetical protein
MYPTGLGVFRREPIPRLLHPTGLGVFRREPIKWLFKFSMSFQPALKFLIILLFVLCVPSYSSLRGSIRVCFYVFRLLVPSKLDSYDVYAPT